MDLAVVTSCSKKGFVEYGRRAIITLDRCWPVEVDLHFVSEDLIVLPKLESGRRLIVHNLFQESTLANQFHTIHKDDLSARGKGYDQLKKSRHGHTGYSFRHDAYKFSKKVFAIDLVAYKRPGGRLFWLDADTVTFAKIPVELLCRLPPDDYPIACLDRQGYHSECGFIGYNLDHEDARNFIRSFAILYASDNVFSLQEWHDSWVFDWLRKKLEIKAYSIPYTNPAHPFVYSELGNYMDHMKGNRKVNGVSHDHPMFTRNHGQKVGHLVDAGQVVATPHTTEFTVIPRTPIRWHKPQRGRR